MPKIVYKPKRFQPKTLELIEKANLILLDYEAQGLILTVRQLYYQFVSRGWIDNNDKSYNRLSSHVNNARLAGLIDWNHLEDRTRNLARLSSWSDPSGIIRSAAHSYHRDLWEDQPYRVEVLIEKDALVGVIERVCEKWDVPFLSCRGYVSQSEMWVTAQRLLRYEKAGQETVVLHMGDHDPSGVDMSRDIEDRLYTFMGRHAPQMERIALNMDQIVAYSPPPNPAKVTDSRAADYIRRFGHESWELDALDPPVLSALIEHHVKEFIDEDLFNEKVEQQEKERARLELVSSRWADVEAFLHA